MGSSWNEVRVLRFERESETRSYANCCTTARSATRIHICEYELNRDSHPAGDAYYRLAEGSDLQVPLVMVVSVTQRPKFQNSQTRPRESDTSFARTHHCQPGTSPPGTRRESLTPPTRVDRGRRHGTVLVREGFR